MSPLRLLRALCVSAVVFFITSTLAFAQTTTANTDLPPAAIARLGAARPEGEPPAGMRGQSVEERLRRPGHRDPVETLAFSADGTMIASGGLDFCIRLWSVRARGQARAVALDRVPILVAFSPAGTTLVAVDAGHAVRYYDVETGTEARVVRSAAAAGDQGGPPVALAPDLSLLAFATSDRHAQIFDLLGDRSRGATDDLGQYPIGALAFSPNGLLLAVSGPEGPARLFDATRAPRYVRALGTSTPLAPCLAWSPDSRFLAAGRFDGTLAVFDVPSRAELKTLAHTNNTGDRKIGAVAFSPDGKLLASWGGDESTIRLWQVGSWKLLAELQGHGHAAVRALAFSPDSKLLASGGADGSILLWDATARR
jgi:WD40 repeat protein